MPEPRDINDGRTVAVIVGLVIMVAGPFWSIWWALLGFTIWIAAFAGAFDSES